MDKNFIRIKFKEKEEISNEIIKKEIFINPFKLNVIELIKTNDVELIKIVCDNYTKVINVEDIEEMNLNINHDSTK
ncbi:MAG: hypothetical protein QXD25_01660 [Nanopusillaceae archaeon]